MMHSQEIKRALIMAIVGAQWGDEGKGKIVDLLCSTRFQVVVRYQGGHNAGHTVKIGDTEYVLHAVPSGILAAHVKCVIGNGVVLDPKAFLDEVHNLEASGIICDGRIKVSDRCHLILPWHQALDAAREKRRGKEAVGTTLRGIGPTYESKAERSGIRAGEAKNLQKFRQRMEKNLEDANRELESLGADTLPESCINEYVDLAEQLGAYVENTAFYLNECADAEIPILLEGAQGTMLDIDHGSYPFATSSNPNLGGAITGSGISPFLLSGALGVVKAYTTRVGAGAFATELTDDIGEYLQQTGHEVGASTGRPRRCGWFDAPVVKYSNMLNRFSGMALTKLDVLDGLDEIKICVGYEGLESMPADWSELDQVVPLYERMEGWKTAISDIREFGDLPEATKRYIRRIEHLCGLKAHIISVGPERHQTIILPDSPLSGWL